MHYHLLCVIKYNPFKKIHTSLILKRWTKVLRLDVRALITLNNHFKDVLRMVTRRLLIVLGLSPNCGVKSYSHGCSSHGEV